MKITQIIAILALTALAITGCGVRGGITSKKMGNDVSMLKNNTSSASGKILNADAGDKYQVEFTVQTPKGKRVFKGSLASQDSQLIPLDGKPDLLRVDSYNASLGTVILVHYASDMAPRSLDSKSIESGNSDYAVAYSLKRVGNDFKQQWSLASAVYLRKDANTKHGVEVMSVRHMDHEQALKIDMYLKLNGLITDDVEKNNMHASLAQKQMLVDDQKQKMLSQNVP